MSYLIPAHLIGKMPCMWCGKIVISPSMDGPGVCPVCDMGMKYEDGKLRKWRTDDREFKQFMSGKPHPNFLYEIKNQKI